MKLWTLSDLHLNPSDFDNDPIIWSSIPDADVAVIAGDIGDGSPERSLEWIARKILPHMPVVMVMGNHDYFGEDILDVRPRLMERAAELGIHLLDDSTITIAGTRFVGSTLWTDYDLYSDGEEHARRRFEIAAKNILSDHSQIGLRSGEMELFAPRHAVRLHLKSRAFIEDTLRQDFDGSTVVVTHHAPHPGSVSPEFNGDIITPAFVSDMSDIFGRFDLDLWVHGHTHASFDYDVDGTRVVCNARGYGYEIEGFDPELVIDISRYGPKPPSW
ncbi:metallophosphoesterase [Pelagibacterium luteolum]|uniref:Calcineurin-like phosphoesterase n=1 Tax=Pelagibacterium luteolum TaxID=440168 RepID=A0A1G7XHI9_9HYPH|nr:metallophosphoesterase [Pelagibacterium luteolum]SDG83689.1 Calcineurin-like phosphoesterase [Pelagibacterium luteolum]